jgi:hypothetical protein
MRDGNFDDVVGVREAIGAEPLEDRVVVVVVTSGSLRTA